MDSTNRSNIVASYKPHDYRKARFGADLGDADLPLPDFDAAAREDNDEQDSNPKA